MARHSGRLMLAGAMAAHPSLSGVGRQAVLGEALREAALQLGAGTSRAIPRMRFRDFIATLHPRYRFYDHCERAIEVLQAVADGEKRRVMFFWPPRHGKTELMSRLFPAYYESQYPDRFVGLNSYAADLAYTMSRIARDYFQRAGGHVLGDAAAVRHWETDAGGGVWAAGVGGPITGKGFHLGIIDDPIKNAAEAASERIRTKHQAWYESTFYTRAEPDAAILLAMTRWHELDLAGWLLQKEEQEPEGWHVVHFEAIKESTVHPVPESCTREPDRRPVGAPLCPERYPLERLQRIQRRLTAYFWNALFQGRPRPKEGNKFKRAWFPIEEALPRNPDGSSKIVREVRAWDKAATAGDGDFTAGVRMARDSDGLYWIVHVERGQWSTGTRDKRIRDVAGDDGAGVLIRGEQEPGASGKDAAIAFRQLLVGYSVNVVPSSGNKEIRAEPLASAAEVGLVRLLRGQWNTVFLNELMDFPNGRNDDQVDAAAGAFNELALGVVNQGGDTVDF